MDKKSKSPVLTKGRKKKLILQRETMLLPGRIIPASRRKQKKGRMIQRITTAGILTVSHRKQAQKAGKKVQKAKGKLPKNKEYTPQRVFDGKTGKRKYVLVTLNKEKPFQKEGIPKATLRRMENVSRNFVHSKIAETEKENSAVEGAHKNGAEK